MDIRYYYWDGATSSVLKKHIFLSCLPERLQQLVAGRVPRFTILIKSTTCPHDIICIYPCLPMAAWGTRRDSNAWPWTSASMKRNQAWISCPAQGLWNLTTMTLIWTYGNSIISYHICIRYIGQWLRICVNIVLNEVENAVNMMAPDCSSWGIPCRGTSGRTFFNYQGFVQYGFVDVGNRMISRFLSCRKISYILFDFLGQYPRKYKAWPIPFIPRLEACGYMPDHTCQEMHLHCGKSCKLAVVQALPIWVASQHCLQSSLP